MRDIKFRAWDVKNKLMIYDIMCGFYKPAIDLESHFEASYADHKMKSKRYLAGNMEWFDDFFPVMQYTGLKDKNGKEIWEGDVVNYNGSKDVVKWEENWGDVECSFSGYSFRCIDPKYIEVIGNIYEHAELLK